MMTYDQAVSAWSDERVIMRECDEHSARKAAQKAKSLSPWIGHVEVSELTTQQVKSAIMELAKTPTRRNKPRSMSTVRKAHLHGRQACEWAVENGYAEENAFAKVKRPKAEKHDAKFLTLDEFTAITALAKTESVSLLEAGMVSRSSFALAVALAASTGARRGELFALEWTDIDFGDGRVSITKAVKDGGQIGRPKTSSGIRSVAIGGGMVELLTEIRDKRVSCDVSSRFVLCDEAGGIANLNSFEHWWRRWADRNGWQGLRFHELRHSHATNMIASGVDLKTVQTRLGHSTADITLNVYAHAVPATDAKAAKLLDAVLFEKGNDDEGDRQVHG